MALVPASDFGLAVEALKFGAFDYVMQPVEPPEIYNALQTLVTMDWSSKIRAAIKNQWEQNGALLNFSPQSLAMQDRMQRLAIDARQFAPITFMTQNCADSQIFARLIHFLSHKRFEPFLQFQCDGLTFAQIEKYLVKSTAKSSKAGTLYFNEITKLDIHIQHRLIDYHDELERIGGDSRYNWRIVTSDVVESESLQKIRVTAEFAERFLSNPITIPSPREIPEDVIALSQYFLTYFSSKYYAKIFSWNPLDIKNLLKHPWRNYAEIVNRIEHAVVMSDDDKPNLVLTVDNEFDNPDSLDLQLHSFELEQVEEILIDKVLRGHHGNISRTAHVLGVSRGTLYNKMRKYGLEPVDSK